MNPEVLERIRKAKEDKATYLDLMDMGIIELPNELFDLKSLVNLNLRNNHLTTIPSKIKNLEKLSVLWLGNNKLRKFPEVLTKLTSLHLLDVSNNKITYIPVEKLSTTNLRDLDSSGNPLVDNAKYLFAGQKFIQNNNLNWKKRFVFEYVFEYDTKGYIEGDLDKVISKVTKMLNYLKKGFKNSRFIEESFFKINVLNQMIFVGRDWITNPLKVFIVTNELKYSKKSLNLVRKKIDEFIEEQSLKVERYFYHPKDGERINYDYLLKLKEVGENIYVSKESGKKYDIYELLSFIEPTIVKSFVDEEKIQELKNDFFSREENKPFITKIAVKNFKIFKEIELDLVNGINIILGNNGLGKTSFLQALTIGLLPINNEDKSNELSGYLRFDQKKTDVNIHWGEYQRELWFYDNEVHEQEQRFNPQPILIAYSANVFANDLLDTDDIAKNLIKGEDKSYQTKSIFANYDKGIFDPNHFFFNPLLVLEKLFLEVHRAKEKDKQQVQGILDELLNKINYFLSITNVKQRIQIYQKETIYFFKGFGQEKLKLKHLSEGYRNNVLIISDILFRIMATRKSVEKVLDKKIPIKEVFREARGVILIDEFDRHLHPTWQRKLTQELNKVLPNIQFILTTHNPVAIMGRKAKEIHVLDIDDEGEVYFNPYLTEGTENINVGTVLLIYFGLESILSIGMQQKVEKYHQLRMQDNRSESEDEEFRRLEKKITKSWIGETIYNQKYLAFLRFLKEHNIENYEDVEDLNLSQEEIQELAEKLKEFE